MRKGLEFSLTLDDIVVPEICPVLGIPVASGAATRDNRPSLDRLDNAKGYTRSNVRVISYRANRIKNDASVDELKAIYEYVARELSRSKEGDDA